MSQFSSSPRSIQRRHFLKTTVGAGLLAGWMTSCQDEGNAHQTDPPSVAVSRQPMMLQEIKEAFYDDVIIDRLEVVRVEKAGGLEFVRAYSTDGAIGIIPASPELKYLMPIFQALILPFFKGRNALDIESLIDEIYRHASNYTFAGMPFWTCVAHAELAILDMLGKVAARPVADFFGSSLRKKIPVYLSTFDRVSSAEAYIDQIQQAIEGTYIRAVKLQIGGQMSNNADCLPGRTEKLIPLARKALGDDFTLYVDANGSYDADKAIEIGQLLQDHGVALFEEPCPWQDVVATKAVSDRLSMDIGGGKQNSSLHQFAHLMNEGVVNLIQPNVHHVGGFIRSLRIVRMAEQAGLSVSFPNPGIGPSNAYMLHLASICSNMGPFQEFRPDTYPEGIYFPATIVEFGKLTASLGAGWGIGYDSQIWPNMKVLS
ncbi:MAG: mandelate racemase/muconate lactonizing enzyme family protein [Bacteroidota bacterium]